MDEPTVGVDPQSRNNIFEMIEKLRDGGTSIIYTTHYMEEAERLCDRIAIVDHGKLAALDTPLHLKDTVSGADVVEAEFENAPAGWRELLLALPHATAVSERNGVTHISSSSGPETVGALMDG